MAVHQCLYWGEEKKMTVYVRRKVLNICNGNLTNEVHGGIFKSGN